jgi:hypothetical protein
VKYYKTTLTELSFRSIFVWNPEGSGDEAELAEVPVQLGVIDPVLQAADENCFRLMAELDSRP